MPGPVASNHLLLPHPACTPAHVDALTATVSRDATSLCVEYHLRGDLQFLLIPERRAPAREDDLWRHTCFELFAAPDGDSRYREFNFSPSGAWAAYDFADYRSGMVPAPVDAPLLLDFTRVERGGVLSVKLGFDSLCGQVPAAALRLGLTAVVEDHSGRMSYWALRHPAEKPDFHDAGGFVARLP
jgi:hypothetical protein